MNIIIYRLMTIISEILLNFPSLFVIYPHQDASLSLLVFTILHSCNLAASGLLWITLTLSNFVEAWGSLTPATMVAPRSFGSCPGIHTRHMIFFTRSFLRRRRVHHTSELLLFPLFHAHAIAQGYGQTSAVSSSSPLHGKLLGVDLPLFNWATNEDFLRRLIHWAMERYHRNGQTRNFVSGKSQIDSGRFSLMKFWSRYFYFRSRNVFIIWDCQSWQTRFFFNTRGSGWCFKRHKHAPAFHVEASFSERRVKIF